jgi:hypothetical protein
MVFRLPDTIFRLPDTSFGLLETVFGLPDTSFHLPKMVFLFLDAFWKECGFLFLLIKICGGVL